MRTHSSPTRLKRWFGYAALLLVPLLGGCNRLLDDPSESVGVREIGPVPGGTEVVEPTDHERKRRACENTLREALDQPASLGAPEFEGRRAAILASAKSEPLMFVEEPRHRDVESASVAVKSFRHLVETSRFPWSSVKKVIAHFGQNPADGRATLLKDGYLYANTPELAFALTSQVEIRHLFGHDKVWIQRGEDIFYAERGKAGAYFFTSGPQTGKRVNLLHLDRLGHGDPPAEALHRDLRSLMYRLHFSRMRIRHITPTRVVANLKYGPWWVPSVLRSEGARLELECEIIDENIAEDVNSARALSKRQTRVVQAMRHAMLDQIDERLPFDEPRHEYGHQFDGRLRTNWSHAYLNHRQSFAFNGDLYFVYDSEGRPHTPQVCVDFLTDTLERASGTWFAPRGETPKRRIGGLDMTALAGAPLRQAPALVAFAKEHPEWFDVFEPERTRSIELRHREQFYAMLETDAAQYQPGDIIMIRGPTPWDPTKMHYHSFFIYERDPVTGIPMIVTGNAGTPTNRSWEIEARRTPQRRIVHRLRPRLEWLESLIAPSLEVSERPLTLAPAGVRR